MTSPDNIAVIEEIGFDTEEMTNRAVDRPATGTESMFFFKTDTTPAPNAPEGDAESASQSCESKEEKWYVCRQCRQQITQPEFQFAVQGRHEHTFANPSGIVFDIKCFSNARGYSFIGPSSEEFTWFSGHSWRIIVCSSCMTHIGWYFAGSSGRGFFGFIADRLTQISFTSE